MPSWRSRTIFRRAILGLLMFIAGSVAAQAAPVFSNVADTNTTAPGHGVFTGGFGVDPSVSGSNVAFLGGYSGGSGIYTGTVGATGAAKIVDTLDTAPGHGVFTGFNVPTVGGSNVAFLGGYSGGLGIYTGTVGATGAAKIVDTLDTAPGHGVFTGFGNVASASGSNVAFRGVYSGGEGIYAGTVGATGAAKIVDTLDTAPGHGVFTLLIEPSVSGSNVAFRGFYSGGSGIYTGTVGATGAAKIVDTLDTAPGHGVFTGYGETSVSGSNVAFQGGYSGGSGIYTGTVGATGAAKIVDTLDTAPGHGVFTGFGQPSVSGSNVAFWGKYSGGSGIYLESGGGLTALLNTGDSLFGSTVTTLRSGRFAYANNQIAFNYSLANGVSGIATVSVVPEPSTFFLAIAALAGLGLFGLRAKGREQQEQ